MISHPDAPGQPDPPPDWAVGLWTSPRTAGDLCGIPPELVADLVRGGRIRTERRGTRVLVSDVWTVTQTQGGGAR
jgi:hypothetical protein